MPSSVPILAANPHRGPTNRLGRTPPSLDHTAKPQQIGEYPEAENAVIKVRFSVHGPVKPACAPVTDPAIPLLCRSCGEEGTAGDQNLGENGKL